MFMLDELRGPSVILHCWNKEKYQTPDSSAPAYIRNPNLFMVYDSNIPILNLLDCPLITVWHIIQIIDYSYQALAMTDFKFSSLNLVMLQKNKSVSNYHKKQQHME